MPVFAPLTIQHQSPPRMKKRNSFGGKDYCPGIGTGSGIAATQQKEQQPKLILSIHQWKQKNNHTKPSPPSCSRSYPPVPAPLTKKGNLL
jgi:hypothetical protein